MRVTTKCYECGRYKFVDTAKNDEVVWVKLDYVEEFALMVVYESAYLTSILKAEKSNDVRCNECMKALKN